MRSRLERQLAALIRPGECAPGERFCAKSEVFSALTRPGECGRGEVFCERRDKMLSEVSAEAKLTEADADPAVTAVRAIR